MHSDSDRGHNNYGHQGNSYGHQGQGRSGHGRSGGHHSHSGGHGGERRGTPLSELDPALTSVSHTFIGCARDVHMALGPGYEVEVYMEALKHEMDQRSLSFKAMHPFAVNYKSRKVGTATADLYVADRFLVKVMAAPQEIGSYERTQLRAQLRAADLELGLIVNFAGRLLKDGLVRVLNPDKLRAMRGETVGAAGAEGEGEAEAGQWGHEPGQG